MKNIFKKQNLMPVIVLSCICLVVAVLMGVVNMFTSPVIQKNEEQKVYESLKVVLDGYFDPIEKPENAPSTVTAIFRVTEEDQLIGHVITLEQKGYADKILMTVGVDKDNKITKVVITSQNESHGKNINPLLDRFASVSADQVSGVEHVSGATITSGYIKNAISDVFKTIDLINKNSDNNGGEEQDPYASFRELLDGTFEVLELPEGAPSTVKALYKVTDGGNLVGHVVSLQQKGFEGDILLNVGIDNNGKITKVVITDQSESHGRDITPLLDGFVSVDKDGVDGVEHVSGATFTSGYIKDAVSDAFKVIGSNEEEKLPTSDENLLVLASELVGEGSEFTNITTEGGTFVKRIFSENSGKGYVVYLVVMNERYGTVESETLVHVGKDKKIVNVTKLTWKTSDASDMYTPPVEETVDAFYATLAGKSLSDLEALLALENNDGQLVTGATSTSKNLVTSLVEALTAVSALRTEEIKDLASELVGGSNLTEMEITEATYVKKLYKAYNGYIAHLVVINERYNRVETETLLHVGNDGKIITAKKLVWKTSDAGWGYEPPTDEVVDPFYARLVGFDLAGLENLLVKVENGEDTLVSNATSTSTALVNSIIEALTIINALPKDEIKDLASEIVLGAELTEVAVSEATYIKRIFDAGEVGYVVHLEVINERYNRTETETLVHISNDGKIVAVKKLVWKTSDAGWGYEPPAIELVDAFYATLAGKNLSDLEALLALETNDGQLVTGATTTSKAFVTSLVEAVTAVNVLAKGEIKNLASELACGAELTELNLSNATYIKHLYKYANGYVAHLVVINERYNRVETETLVNVSNDGKIVAVNKLVWKTSDAGWGYEPPVIELVDAFYATLAGKNLSDLESLLALETNEGQLVTGATTTSKAFVTSLVEAVETVNALRAEEIKSLASELAGGAELTEVEVSDATYLKALYKFADGYVAHLIVINERYNRVETETLVHISNDGKIKDVKKLVWKTSDAGWGYEPPAIELVDAFYATLAGKNLSDLEALLALETNEGQLVTGATTTSKAFVTSLVEAVKTVNTLRAEEIKSLASELAGGAELTEVEVSDATYLKKLYKLSDGYIAHLIVINERYNRVETETLVYISNDGKIKDVKKLVWKTSDAGWGYEPPAIELVDAFYATLAGKNLSDLEALLALETNEGQLVSGATTTSKAFVTSLVEAVTVVNTIEASNAVESTETNVPRIIGIVALSVMVIAMTTCIVVPKLNKGGKANEQ